MIRRQRFPVVDIERGAQSPALQLGQQCAIVHDPGPRRIDQVAVVRHHGELGRTDHVMRLRRRRRMDHDDRAAAHQLRQVDPFDTQFGGGFIRQVRIGDHDLGAERLRLGNVVPAHDTHPDDTGANLPTEPVTLRWLDLGPSARATLLEAFFPAYEQAHPTITVQYEQAPGLQRNEIIPLGIQSGDAPDVFLAPTTVTPGQMVREGWVRPLNDIIPNFEEWKQRFPPGTLVEGINVFNGQVYACPFESNKFHGSLLLYNVDYLQQAGYDPSETPLTWEDFREAARKVTEQGNGEYCGFILGGSLPGRWSEITAVTAALAGAPTGPFADFFSYINWQAGEFSYTSDEFIAAIELWLALRDDGSVYPGVTVQTCG